MCTLSLRPVIFRSGVTVRNDIESKVSKRNIIGNLDDPIATTTGSFCSSCPGMRDLWSWPLVLVSVSRDKFTAILKYIHVLRAMETAEPVRYVKERDGLAWFLLRLVENLGWPPQSRTR